jgi:prophage regulatory protein
MTEQLQLLKIRDVTRLTSLHRATIYRAIERGEFPKQVRISRSRVAWRAAEISDWINRQQA